MLRTGKEWFHGGLLKLFLIRRLKGRIIVKRKAVIIAADHHRFVIVLVIAVPVVPDGKDHFDGFFLRNSTEQSIGVLNADAIRKFFVLNHPVVVASGSIFDEFERHFGPQSESHSIGHGVSR